MISLQLGDDWLDIPSDWNDLNDKQLPAVMAVFGDPKTNDAEKKIHLFKILTGLSFFRLWIIGAANIEELLYLTDFLYASNTLTKNVIPNFKHKTGPSDSFDNLLISEFVFTEQYYTQYRDESETAEAREASMNKVIAILYRDYKSAYNVKLNPDGDAREKFNPNIIPHSEEQVSKWPVPVKLAILHWYEGCRLKLMRDFPEVFNSSGGGEPSKFGLWDLIYNIADKGTFGDFSQVENQYLKTILMALTKIMSEAEQLKKTT